MGTNIASLRKLRKTNLRIDPRRNCVIAISGHEERKRRSIRPTFAAALREFSLPDDLSVETHAGKFVSIKPSQVRPNDSKRFGITASVVATTTFLQDREINPERQTPMKYISVISIIVCLVFTSTVDAQHSRKTTSRKASTSGVQSIRDCPDEGNGGDPNLNRRKNIRSDNHTATVRTISWMKSLPDPKTFQRGGSRTELTRVGEGKKVTVVAYALVARKGSKESCNCGLSAPKDTDNHIVLVDPTIKNPSLAHDETDSVTAEFTPRVRLDHPSLAGAKLQALIQPKGRRLVRVTGLLLFDSEHFLGRHLKRHNNWEIHPVTQLDYCVAATCQDTGTVGWKSLEAP
jgi:hypothetical protein